MVCACTYQKYLLYIITRKAVMQAVSVTEKAKYAGIGPYKVIDIEKNIKN
jgi:hypothetical protein